MSRNRSSKDKQTLLLYLAFVVFLILTGAYFALDWMPYQNWKNFLQGVSGNIIATILSFIIVYLFLTRHRISLNDDETSSRTLDKTNEILSRINEVLSGIDTVKGAVAFHDRMGKVDEIQNPNWLWIAHNEGPNKEKLEKISKVDRNLDECLKKVTALLEGNLDAEERYAINKENTSLTIELGSLKGRLQNFQAELQLKEGEISRKNRELDDKNHEVSLKQRKLEEKDEDLRRKDREIREIYENLSSIEKQIGNLGSTVKGFADGLTNNLNSMNTKLVHTIGNSNTNQEQVLQRFKSNTNQQLEQLEQFGNSTNSQLAKITKLLESSKENG